MNMWLSSRMLRQQFGLFSLWLILLSILLLLSACADKKTVAQSAQSIQRGPVIGEMNEGHDGNKYYVLLQFGMEVFQDGKQLDQRQLWTLGCDYLRRPAVSANTTCSLDTRNLFKDPTRGGTIIQAYKYWIAGDDANHHIVIKEADWEAGILKHGDTYTPLHTFHTTHKRMFGKSLSKKRGRGKRSKIMKHLTKEYGVRFIDGKDRGKPVPYFRL